MDLQLFEMEDNSGLVRLKEMNFLPQTSDTTNRDDSGDNNNNSPKMERLVVWRSNESKEKGQEVVSMEEKLRSERGKIERAKVCSRGHWRPSEDAMLKDLVAQFGPQNWNLIANHLTGRSGKSCRLRWFNQLDPRINKRAFTEQEEERLLEAHRVYGNKWSVIARLFHGRTDNAIKNHWHVIMARKTRERCSYIHKMSSGAGKKTSLPSIRSVHGCGKGSSVKLAKNDIGRNACRRSIENESVSTCTDLSLSPSSKSHVWFANGAPGAVRKRGEFENQTMSAENKNIGKERSDDSDSSDSGILGADLVGKSTTACTRRSDENNSFPFFDFLGVGAS